MTAPIPLNLACEDELTESVVGKILHAIPTQYATRTIYNRGGYGYLRKHINGFNRAARGIPFLVVTDLDRHTCPQALIDSWVNAPKHRNLLIRVAVTEVEAWLLADKAPFARFLGIRQALIPDDVESLPHPKEVLIDLARRSSRGGLRRDICPAAGSTSTIGPNYNPRLAAFVRNSWDPYRAANAAESLRRMIDRLTAFRPFWPAANAN